MQLLRKILRDSIPELADALERSWTIALDEWLAAIAPQMDSFNAFPHLRNHEKHIERIWSAYQKHHGASATPLLSPIEIYVMLSSILFHDIGRTRTSKDHGEASKVIIENNRAELGIPSDALADVIARISRFHDLPAREMRSELNKLSTTSIDPYGEIRQSACAALLTLIDYMDGTVTRVTPAYIRDSEDIRPVGAFRRVIRDVEIDFEGELVKVVLGDRFEPAPGKAPEWKLVPDFKRYTTEELLDWAGTSARLAPYRVADLDGCLASSAPSRWTRPPDAERWRLFFQVAGRSPEPGEQLVARQYARCKPDEAKSPDFPEPWSEDQRARVEKLVGCTRSEDFVKETKELRERCLLPMQAAIQAEVADRRKEVEEAARKTAGWPTELLLAVVLGNIRENAEVLRQIRQTLWTMGVPVRAWLVEWKEHLFNEYGEETREPILSTDDLKRTLDSMVSLATRGPRSAGIPYDTLAAEVREMNVCKTRRAVRRIAIVWRDGRSSTGGEKAPVPMVLVGQSEWRLLPGAPVRGAWLDQASLLLNRLDGLKQPDAGEAE